ncbi:MAG: hypothetical protein IJ242_06065 [Clostridia bacterium]|nr:hypothetical protein [Clostridia bacterium]
MRFVKCPRCELNYIPETEEYCPVCKREMKGERHEDPVELCSICNENPVMPGRDVCYECYKEMTQQQGRVSSEDDVETEEQEVDIGMEDVSEIEEIDLGDIPESDVSEPMDDQISLEEEQSKELEMDMDDEESEFEDN